MQSLIERALVNEDSDVQALRELAVDLTVDGDEPSPRVMTDGGRSPTARDADLLLARDPVLWWYWEDLEDEVDR